MKDKTVRFIAAFCLALTVRFIAAFCLALIVNIVAEKIFGDTFTSGWIAGWFACSLFITIVWNLYDED